MAGYVRKEYEQSDALKALQASWQNRVQEKPGDYVSRNQEKLNQLWDRIQGRDPFSYDIGSDILYQQYKDRYIRQGQKAMMDTMGQAATLTGGYGNSYAQTVGQQTYGAYLQELDSKLPELYRLAMDRYQLEGDRLQDQYSALGQQEQEDYSRYRDTVSDWNQETERLYREYLQQRDFEYGKYRDQEEAAYDAYRDGIADNQWESAFGYQQEQDLKAYEQWLQEFEYQKQEDERKHWQWEQEFQEDQRRYNQQQAASSASGRGSGKSSAKKEEEPAQLTRAEEFVENMLQNAIGSRFNPERVIKGSNYLGAAEKEQALSYLKKVLSEGRMK